MSGRTYGWFEVDSVAGARFELALEFFTQGRFFIFDGVAFARQSGALVCSVLSSWIQPTEETAHADLEHAEKVLEHLIQSSPEFARLANDLPRVVQLVEDSGMGTVVLAEQRDAVLHWFSGRAG